MRIKHLIPVAMAMLAILAALACGGESATPTPESPTDVTENALPSVVQIITDSGSGTGFIVDASGLVVTNRHVVEGERRVTVSFATGEEYRGNVVQRHPAIDLAYVEIDSIRTFTALTLGNSGEVRVSESVIAIGYPLGEELGVSPTVSRGIISAKRDDYLQTDASVNPGNSGGPLLDSKGHVIGVITTRIESTETGRPVTGIGFAIPIDTVKQDLGGLAASGSASPNATATPLPAIPPTPDIEATKAAIEAMDAHRRQAEQATRAATEAQQEADRYAASLEATRIAELPTPTPTQSPRPTPTPSSTPLPAIPPTPDIEATKTAIAALDARQRQSAQATRTAIEAQQEAEQYAASLEATRIAELPTPTLTPIPPPVTIPTVTPRPTATPLPAPSPVPTLLPQTEGRDHFTRGSSHDEVLLVQGTPDEINTYRATGIEIWNYGWSTVTFSLANGLVTEWRNDGNLKVELLPSDNATSAAGYFTRGSSQDEVLLVQGTPDEINTYRATGIEIWNYGWSTVTLSLPNGLVTAWRNDGDLKAELLPSDNATSTAGYFTRGSSQDEVLLVQGTPDEINTYRATGIEIWSYEWSTVTFSLPDGLVTDWRNDGDLKVR